MGFGGKLQKSGVLEIDGMKIHVARMDNKTRRALSDILTKSKKSDPEELTQGRWKIIVDNLILQWEGLTEANLAKYYVSNATHYGSKSFDVNGDDVDICRASFSELLAYFDASKDFDYKAKAKIAIDDLLESKDAKIEYNGKIRKMNATIREEIKDDEEWTEVVDFIWECASSSEEFIKPDLSNEEISVSSSLFDGAYWNHKHSNIIELVYEFALSAENFRHKEIMEEAEKAKN